MNVLSSRKLILSAVLAAVSALAAHADTLNVKLVSGGNLTASSVTVDGSTESNVYIGPYTLSINGQNTLAMCVDFSIHSVVGDTWTAYGTTVGSSNLSKTYDPTSGQEYEEDAYLFSQIVKPNVSNADRIAIQVAAWDIMAYGITGSSYTSQIGDNSYIDRALANYGTIGTGFEIISDTTAGGEQEFIVPTPEPSSFLLMLAPALALGYMATRKRNAGFSSAA